MLLAIVLGVAASRGAGAAYLVLAIVFLFLGAALFVTSFRRRAEPMRAVDRRYLREFFIAMAAYTLIVVAVPLVMEQVRGVVGRTVLALLPIVPTIFVARALVRRILGGDELERRTFLEATAIAGLVVALASFSLGFLQAAGLVELRDGLIFVLPAMISVWGVALPWVRRRYSDE